MNIPNLKLPINQIDSILKLNENSNRQIFSVRLNPQK